MAIVNKLPHPSGIGELAKVNISGRGTSSSYYYSDVIDTGDRKQKMVYYIIGIGISTSVNVTVELQGSDDQSTWTAVHTNTGPGDSNGRGIIVTGASTDYRYYRAMGHSSNTSNRAAIQGTLFC